MLDGTAVAHILFGADCLSRSGKKSDGGWTCGFGDSSREEKGEQSAERCASLGTWRNTDTPACSNLPRVHIASFALPRLGIVFALVLPKDTRGGAGRRGC